MAGTVHSGDYVGGFVGRVLNNNAEFRNSHFTGTLEYSMVTQQKGGFVGIPTTTRFHDCSSSGNINNNHIRIGGFLGRSADVEFHRCSYSGTIVSNLGQLGGFAHW